MLEGRSIAAFLAMTLFAAPVWGQVLPRVRAQKIGQLHAGHEPQYMLPLGRTRRQHGAYGTVHAGFSRDNVSFLHLSALLLLTPHEVYRPHARAFTPAHD